MSQTKVLAAMIPVTEALERLGIDYYVGGAVASLAHGIYRTTADVDIIAEIRSFRESREVSTSGAAAPLVLTSLDLYGWAGQKDFKSPW